MHYNSTRGAAPVLTFEQAMLSGLARDGGLYLPQSIPRMTPDAIAALAGRPYEDAAFAVMRPFLGETFADDAFRGMIARAYAGFRHPARAPLRQLGPGHFLLELFHGPTLAFKDFAMQLIGQMFEAVLARSGDRVTIVGATSGDTGSAAIEAFRGLPSVDVFILFPEGRVSEVQRRQMTTTDAPNVHAIALRGDFDACQARVKDLFNDLAFRDAVGLAGVNSINWARVLAQVVYYFTAATALGAPHRAVDFTVPTGNFGDIFAGHVARAMGLPVGRLVLATNHNDILHRALTTGRYEVAGVRLSISPSMDIEVSSNFERALFLALDEDGRATAALMEELKARGGFTIPPGALETLRAAYASGRASEPETAAAIARFHAETGEVLCPHTAVGVKVADEMICAPPFSLAEILPPEASAAATGSTAGQVAFAANPMITLATAHPAKFPDAVEAATGTRPALPPHMAGLFDRPERVATLPDDLAALQEFIRERIAH